MSDLIKLIDFPLHGDDRGALIALESKKNIPFEIKRVYYIFNTQTGVSRGFHAHKKLQQMAICLKGSCRFIMDNGLTKENVILDSPNQGIFIDAMEWHEMHDFSDDCILIVLASDIYNEVDYLRNYNDFLIEISKK